MQNKTFIITGAASGIGLATARLLHQRGARLALWDQNAAALEPVAAELSGLACSVDVRDGESVQSVLVKSLAHFGNRLDGVIHAAGILRTDEFTEIERQAQQQMIEVNLIGTLNVAHAVLPHLRESRGSLVMMASASAFYGSPEYAIYGATKAAILSFAQSLRVELAGSGVHIGVVCPLFVASPMLAGYNGATHLIRSRSPFFETRSPASVAQMIVTGIERRQFMILPGWRTRLLFGMSRFCHPLMHGLTLMTYRQGGG